MSVTTTLMVDVTGGSLTPKLGLNGMRFAAGYVSGKPGTGVEWSAEQWDSIRPATPVRIYQGATGYESLGSFDEIDVESGAVTPEEAALIVKNRVGAGYTWTNIYGTRDSIAATTKALEVLRESIFIGHVTCRLADWSLSRVEAEALVGTFVGGMTCIGVQWASPTSNPNTIMPGPSGLTLKEANCDLSVVDVSWVPSLRVAPPTPPPPVGGPVTVAKILVEMSDGSSKIVWTA